MSQAKTYKRIASFSVLGAFLAAAFVFGQRLPVYQAANVPTKTKTIVAAAPAVSYDRFGIEAERFETVEREISRNETFAEILADYNIPYETVVRLADVARPVFDVRHLRAGRALRVYTDDASGDARYLVYQRDPIHYVVFNLSDSLDVYEGRRPVRVEQRLVRGIINSSLYSTLDDEGVDPRVATKLAEVFAWQIDFFRIQKGDFFSVLFEEKLVDGEPVEIGRVVAARFNHFGEDYYGFQYDDGEQTAYYDDEGNSLRKAFLKAPLKYERISSRYTLKRFHPVQKRWKAHLGTDYAAAPGTPIYAVGDGVILEAQFRKHNGNYVKIRHNGTYTTGYLHMSRIAKGIRPGARVQQGDVIGYVGSTGLATGPHLCYRFWKHGEQVDPLREEFPSANPIPDAHRAAFERSRDALRVLLDEDPAPEYAANGGGEADAVL